MLNDEVKFIPLDIKHDKAKELNTHQANAQQAKQ